MLLAYNTNGLAHHDLFDAIWLLADIGYRGVSLTIDHHALNPFDERTPHQTGRVAELLKKLDLRCFLETGARYLLDPRVKHEPTLVTADPTARQRRVDYLCWLIDLAHQLDADGVSIWSGVVHDASVPTEAFSRLTESLERVLNYAAEKSVTLAFEPEPGMLIDTLDAYRHLCAALATSSQTSEHLRLTMDIGHLHCQGEVPIPAKIKEYGAKLANVHIEDMLPDVHEHLMFGEGTIDFPPVLAALAEIGYHGFLSVELSRHSPEGPVAAQKAFDFLQPLVLAANRRLLK